MRINIEKRDNINVCRQDSEEVWKKSICSFIKMSYLETESSQQQVDLMPLQREMTVIDLCCGSGRWAIPIAKRVKKVTVIDNSEIMLDECMARAKAEGIDNIEPVLMNIFDADSGNNVEICDTVVCSRSVPMRDLKFLSSFARELAIVGAWGNGPSIPALRDLIIEGTCDNPTARVTKNKNSREDSYNRFWNEAYNLGYDPNLLILPDYFKATYNSREDAYEDLKDLAIDEISHIDVFKSNIDRLLTEKAGKFELCLETQSTLMWWKVN